MHQLNICHSRAEQADKQLPSEPQCPEPCCSTVPAIAEEVTAHEMENGRALLEAFRHSQNASFVQEEKLVLLDCDPVTRRLPPS